MRWLTSRAPLLKKSTTEIKMQRLTIPITGMSCGGCVNNVRTAFSRISGVTDAQVTVGEATVTYEPKLTNPDALRRAVTDAGYGVAAA